jgi:hypothetical protein
MESEDILAPPAIQPKIRSYNKKFIKMSFEQRRDMNLHYVVKFNPKVTEPIVRIR